MCPCVGAKDPTALETLVKSMNVKTESTEHDLCRMIPIVPDLCVPMCRSQGPNCIGDGGEERECQDREHTT